VSVTSPVAAPRLPSRDLTASTSDTRSRERQKSHTRLGSARVTQSEGFTLIELLIVVVIIGILAAIAIPKFANTKQQAYLATLKSDLRNLVTAEEAYFADHTTYTTALATTQFDASQGVTYSVTTASGTGWPGQPRTSARGATPSGCHIAIGTSASTASENEGAPYCRKRSAEGVLDSHAGRSSRARAAGGQAGPDPSCFVALGSLRPDGGQGGHHVVALATRRLRPTRTHERGLTAPCRGRPDERRIAVPRVGRVVPRLQKKSDGLHPEA